MTREGRVVNSLIRVLIAANGSRRSYDLRFVSTFPDLSGPVVLVPPVCRDDSFELGAVDAFAGAAARRDARTREIWERVPASVLINALCVVLEEEDDLED